MTTDDIFGRFAPFVQEFIYRERWTELREIQVEAARCLFDTDDHLLVCSGTASGKTEAAFLPALSDLFLNPSRSIGILYIGPLKALIDDQFARLRDLLTESKIPVQNWHGDVSLDRKSRFLKLAKGVLQITPESLESMLIRHERNLGRLFGDLRYVIIDEVHAFISSERGQQIQCQLSRLERHQSRLPRRIGLSATIGDVQLAAGWLRGNTSRTVQVVQDSSSSRKIELGVDYYPDLDLEQLAEISSKSAPTLLRKRLHRLTEDLHRWTLRGKTLIFVNTRASAEVVAYGLRQTAKQHGTDDIYHVHHGSIDKSLRKLAEQAMQEPDSPACTIATVTLELGIDIGQLDQVMQINAPHSVSSFLQRLGRSGRRNQPSRMFFCCFDGEQEGQLSGINVLPWDLLQSIAIIQLYLEERWIEPPEIPQHPFSLLYHQVISIIAGSTQISPPDLAERVLTVPAFSSITPDHLRDLLRHLISIEHIEVLDSGNLIVGRKAEPLLNDYRFYAVFQDRVDFQVWHGSNLLGSIHDLPRVGERILLGGRIWRVRGVEPESYRVHVEPSSGAAQGMWHGSGPRIHSKVIQKIRSILVDTTIYPYLLSEARERLEFARETARSEGITSQSVIEQREGEFLILPWTGTRAFETILAVLEFQGVALGRVRRPFWFQVRAAGNQSPDDIRKCLQSKIHSLRSARDLLESFDERMLMNGKYDRFVPTNLLIQAAESDWLDLDSARQAMNRLTVGEQAK